MKRNKRKKSERKEWRRRNARRIVNVSGKREGTYGREQKKNYGVEQWNEILGCKRRERRKIYGGMLEGVVREGENNKGRKKGLLLSY